MKLQADLKKIKDADLQVVAVSYDSVDVLSQFAESADITFPLLSDEGSATIDAFGVRNKEVAAGSRQDGIPYPGTFLIDKSGKIRAKIVLDGYIKRHTTEQLLEAAAQLE